MRFTSERKPLLEAFSKAAGAANGRSPVEVIRNVRVTAGGGIVRFVGTNFEQYVEVSIPADIEGDGVTLLDAEKVKGALDCMASETVTVEGDDVSASVKGGKGSIRLQTGDPALFPEMPTLPDASERWGLGPTQLWLMAKRTKFACDTKTSKYALGGCKVEFLDGAIAMVATDGNRIARQEVAVEGSRASGLTAIVPPKALELANALFDGAESVKVGFAGPVETPLSVYFSSEEGTVVSRLVSGRFPNYEMALPKPSEVRATARVSAGSLKTALKLASLATSEETRQVRFRFSEGELVVRGSAADRGHAESPVGISYQGEPMEIAWDHRYLDECLRQIDSESEATFALVSPKSNALLTLDGGFTYMMAPMILA